MGKKSLKLADKYFALEKNTREYSILGEAYTDFLFNQNLIKSTEKEQFEKEFYFNHREQYEFHSYLGNTLINQVEAGLVDEHDYIYKDAITQYESELEHLEKVGAELIPTLNLLAEKSNILPTLSHETTLNEFGETGLSRFIDNSYYGEWNNDELWIFNSKHRFLNIISNKTNNSTFVK